MSVKFQLSFSSGEIDPILHDNVFLAKFKKGLETARNTIVGKAGTIMSRFGRAHFIKAKNDNEKIKLFCPVNSGIVTEWGNGYVRVYDFDATLLVELAHTFTEEQLEDIHFLSSKDYVYAFLKGHLTYRLDTDNLLITIWAPLVGNQPGSLVITPVGTPAGYAVDYAITSVRKGEEGLPFGDSTGTYKKPDASGQSNEIEITISTFIADINEYNEIRIYRRPHEGSGYGLIGTSTNIYIDGTYVKAKFKDLGGLADFTNGIPNEVIEGYEPNYYPFSNTGTIYQQRLLITDIRDEEGILASRPGFQRNFQRDFPYDADSALKFKSGTSGNARVLRMIDNDGLIVFTSVGVYISLGVLSVNNLALEKKGSWIIDEKIPPLVVPGGVFFVDKSTNAIRHFVFSQDIGTYQSVDLGIFSNHFFTGRTVTSWAFQGGTSSLIIITFSDGTFATFTYDLEHQMKAWTRHDSDFPLEQVEGTGVADSTFFVTNKNGNRYIEVSLPRKIPADVVVSNPESDKIALNFMLDASVTQNNLLSLTGADIFELVPTVAGDWESDLTLTCGTSALFVGALGTAGYVFRYFDTSDKTVVSLRVISKTSDNEVIVRPSAEFPSDQASDFRLYGTTTVISGLNHLEGEIVAVVVDGWIASSPNNDIDNYEKFTVVGGAITLPDDKKGAIIVVGRPVTADIKTLNIATVEQSPTSIESLTVNKLYIRVHKSRGLYVSNEFPEEAEGEKDGSSVKGMEDLEVIDVPDGYDILGNTYTQPVSKRIEKTLPGNWDSQGRISLRQVDPLHFEIISIIPDVEIERRTDN